MGMHAARCSYDSKIVSFILLLESSYLQAERTEALTAVMRILKINLEDA